LNGIALKRLLASQFGKRLFAMGGELSDVQPMTITFVNDKRVHVEVVLRLPYDGDLVEIKVYFNLDLVHTYGCMFDNRPTTPGIYNEILRSKLIMSDVAAQPYHLSERFGAQLLYYVTLSLKDIERELTLGMADAMVSTTFELGAPATFTAHHEFFHEEGNSSPGFRVNVQDLQQNVPCNPLCPPPPGACCLSDENVPNRCP
jgi:hypothetical protein